MPSEAFVRVISEAQPVKPIVVDRRVFQSVTRDHTPTGMEIVTWQSVTDVLALKFLPVFLHHCREAKILASIAPPPSVIFLGSPECLLESLESSGPSQFEIQMQQNRPSPRNLSGPSREAVNQSVVTDRTRSSLSFLSQVSITRLPLPLCKAICVVALDSVLAKMSSVM